MPLQAPSTAAEGAGLEAAAQWIADLNLDPLSRFDSYMRAKVRQLYISLFHAYARKNNMWILNHGEALLKVGTP